MSNNLSSLSYELRRRLPAFLRNITISEKPIEEIAQRRKSRLLSILLLIMITLFAILDFSYYITIPDYVTPLADLGGYFFLISAYMLNRSGRYRFSSILTVIMVPAVIFSTILTNSSQNIIVTLNFLVIGLLLSSILLNIKSTISLAFVLVFGMLLMPLLVPSYVPNFSMIAGSFITILISSGLMITFMIQRNQIENDRQAELRASEERLSKFINSAVNSYHILDADMKILEINRGALEAIYSADPTMNSKEDVVGLDFLQCYPFLKDKASQYIKVIETGENYTNELVVPHPTLGDLVISSICFKVGDGLGIIAENITERRRAEGALRRSESRATALLEAIPDMMFRLNRQSVFLDYMADKSDIYPQSVETIIGLNNRDITPPEFADLIEQNIKQTLDSGKMQTFEYQLPMSGRGLVEYEARMVKSGADEVIAIVRDTTEFRQTEALIRRQDRLAAVGQLAAGIAHDFNNIMAVITLYSELLLRSPKLTEKEEDKLQIIYQQANRAADLTSQILDFSRQSVMERQPVALLPFLKEFAKLLERTLPEHIKINLIYGEDTYLVKADLTRIQQIIMNLALNARDAMPEGGGLHIGLDHASIGPNMARPLPEMKIGEWIKLVISDDGIGMSPDVIPHLFEPFFTTKKPGKGTGLGLAQVYGIVLQHDGHIIVESQLGHGTTFTIYLPSLPVIQSEETNSGQSDSLIIGKGELILVVEDELTIREALADGLELLNYQVLMAGNGREALAIMEEKHDEIVLVLSDVVMPEMSGLELLQALKQKEMTVPILMLTGHLSGEMLDKLRSEGLTRWLSKPVKLDVLAQAVARLLSDS